jgi:hypothetical protein
MVCIYNLNIGSALLAVDCLNVDLAPLAVNDTLLNIPSKFAKQNKKSSIFDIIFTFHSHILPYLSDSLLYYNDLHRMSCVHQYCGCSYVDPIVFHHVIEMLFINDFYFHSSHRYWCRNVPGNAAFLNGSHGEYTGSDDVDSSSVRRDRVGVTLKGNFPPCPEGSACMSTKHYHSVKKKTKFEGYERRKAEDAKKNSPLCKEIELCAIQSVSECQTITAQIVHFHKGTGKIKLSKSERDPVKQSIIHGKEEALGVLDGIQEHHEYVNCDEKPDNLPEYEVSGEPEKVISEAPTDNIYKKQIWQSCVRKQAVIKYLNALFDFENGVYPKHDISFPNEEVWVDRYIAAHIDCPPPLPCPNYDYLPQPFRLSTPCPTPTNIPSAPPAHLLQDLQSPSSCERLNSSNFTPLDDCDAMSMVTMDSTPPSSTPETLDPKFVTERTTIFLSRDIVDTYLQQNGSAIDNALVAVEEFFLSFITTPVAQLPSHVGDLPLDVTSTNTTTWNMPFLLRVLGATPYTTTTITTNNTLNTVYNSSRQVDIFPFLRDELMKSTGSLLTASFDGQYNKWSYARILDSVNSIDKDYHIELHRSTMVNTVIHVLNRYVSELNGASESFPRGIINMRGARKGVISGINFR